LNQLRETGQHRERNLILAAKFKSRKDTGIDRARIMDERIKQIKIAEVSPARKT